MNKPKIKILSLLFSFIIVALILSNPSESRFLDKLSEDYGAMHGNQRIDKWMLVHVGHSTRSNWVLCSRFNYQFGNIGVSYFGIGGFIIHTGSYTNQFKKSKEIPLKEI